MVYIGGAVAVPDLYPFSIGDTLESLLQAAGGITPEAILNNLNLHITGENEGQESQRVDINRAEAWLLESLPGIGPTLAQRIIDYRQQNGPFRNVQEITRVEGIGTGTYKKINDLITVAD